MLDFMLSPFHPLTWEHSRGGCGGICSEISQGAGSGSREEVRVQTWLTPLVSLCCSCSVQMESTTPWPLHSSTRRRGAFAVCSTMHQVCVCVSLYVFVCGWVVKCFVYMCVALVSCQDACSAFPSIGLWACLGSKQVFSAPYKGLN